MQYIAQFNKMQYIAQLFDVKYRAYHGSARRGGYATVSTLLSIRAIARRWLGPSATALEPEEDGVLLEVRRSSPLFPPRKIGCGLRVALRHPPW